MIEYDIQSSLTEAIVSKVNAKITELIIEGLKLKGFEFENMYLLREFIKSNCRCEETPHLQQSVYFVNDVPFFMSLNEINMEFNGFELDSENKFHASFGKYSFL